MEKIKIKLKNLNENAKLERFLKTMKNNKILDELTKSFSNLNLNSDQLINIYDQSVSIFQKSKMSNGKMLECFIENLLGEKNLKFEKQVIVDTNGYITNLNHKKGGKKPQSFHIIDILINDQIKVGDHIKDMIIVSCKTTCRERWEQDEWIKQFNPKKYILVTTSDDYPSSDKFQESESRKIITNKPKNNDSRKYKLSFNEFETEIKS